MAMATWMIFLSGSLSLLFLVMITTLLYKIWWTPIRVESFLQSQGVKGPAYRFLHGNTKDVIKMKMQAMNGPMEITHETFSRIQPHICSWLRLYGSKFLFWHGPRAQLVVAEPDLIKEVLNNNGTYPKIEVQGFMKKLLGNGLASAKGGTWHKQRKLAHHAFHGESLKGMIPAMLESVETMMEKWRRNDNSEIEVFQEFKLLTSEIISRTAFGSSYLEGKKIVDMIDKIVLMAARNFYNMRIPGISKLVKTADDIESDKLTEEIRNSIMKIVERREEETVTRGQDSCSSDFLGLLIKAYRDSDENSKISMEDLIDECKTFYFTGQETTASSLTWIIFLLANHTEWQEEARREVIQLFGQQHPSSEGINKLKIMSMIINESLRLYPPTGNLLRKASREVRLGKLVVPANVEVFAPMLALHYDPQLWGEDVNLFKPERFAEGVAKATRNNAAHFFPFGLGPRSCAGMNFAVTEMKIVLSLILQRFRFLLSPNYVHSPVQNVTLFPKHGVKVILHAL